MVRRCLKLILSRPGGESHSGAKLLSFLDKLFSKRYYVIGLSNVYIASVLFLIKNNYTYNDISQHS